MKTISIEALLAWAFQDELPKRDWNAPGIDVALASSFDLVARYGETGCEMVSDGRPQAYAAHLGETPDPDALLVEAAVMRLSGLKPVLHEAPSLLLADMAAEVRDAADALADRPGEGNGKAASGEKDGDAATLPVGRFNLVELVRVKAALGTRPDWLTDVPERVVYRPDGWRGRSAPLFVKRQVAGAFGRIYEREEQVACDPKTKRAPKGAYHKYSWRPRVEHALAERLEWLLWVVALETVRDALVAGDGGQLAAHRLSDELPPALPWVTGPWVTGEDIHRENVPVRVIPDLRLEAGGDGVPGAEKAARRVALRPKTRPKAGPMRRVA
ncbi:hypothetical protein L0F51_03970 [Afifella sp. H1R]|uniref:hypothetical protein n=1 Tax=Afifella sp. H1R TaxID=2908841 RepID=UPI001F2851FC|nr:hypothetical protein [Afifella sp. H1R]MCF1502923.1 hypothetical protein [Afifella sp. H1R]